MAINLGKYMDVVEANYIVYDTEKLIEHGNLDRADELFINHNQNLFAEKVVPTDSYASKGRDIAGALDVIAAAQGGSALEQAMEEIAASINEGIESYYRTSGASVDDLIATANDYKRQFTQGSITAKSLNEFFNLIYEGLKEANVSYTGDLVAALTNVGEYMTGDAKFVLGSHWGKEAVSLVSERDMEIAGNIIFTLENAAKKYRQAGGTLDSRSFSSVINRIFKESMGQQIGKAMVAHGVLEGLSDFEKQFAAAPQVSIKDPIKVPNMGSDTSVVFDNEGMSLKVQRDSQSITIEILSKGDVRLENTMRAISFNLTRKTQLGDMFPAPSENRFLAYNILAHKDAFPQDYQELRGSVAATFFREWMDSPEIASNTQLLLIDGKVYPLQRIINNICKSLLGQSGWGDSAPVRISGKWPANTWYGSDWKNSRDALIRSNAVNNVLNTLTIASTLNYNILKRYAY